MSESGYLDTASDGSDGRDEEEASVTDETAVVVGTDEPETSTGEEPDNPGEAVDDADAEDSTEESAVESSADLVERLEREGDIAADYLEEFLDIADVDGDIDLDVEGDRAMVAIVGADLDHLVGPDGEVMEALQDLARLAVYRQIDERSRLMLDIGGFRARRREELVRLAEKVVEEVRSQGTPVRMDPMSPFERKVVHDAVAAAGLVSESEGEEPDRRVVVSPAAE